LLPSPACGRWLREGRLAVPRQAAKLRTLFSGLMEWVVLSDKNGKFGYFLRLLACFFIALFGSQRACAASLAEQRQYYFEAKAALVRGDSKPYQQYAKALADYPLLPHLAYDELTNRLKYASNEEVEAFLAANADLPQINWMKLRWLRWLAERGQWKTFLKYYDEKLNFAELDCLHARYLLSLRDKKAGLVKTEKLWLVGRSQHESCDTLFALWRKAGGMKEAHIWQRAVLAAEAGNYSLARYLARDLKTLKKEAALLVEVAQKPRTVTQTARFTKTSGAMGDVVALGLRRLLREDTEKALALLAQYSKKQRFSEQARLALGRSFGLTLAKRFDPRALDILNKYAPGLTDEDIIEWRIRLLLRDSQTGQLVYETSAEYRGMRSNRLDVFAVLFQAALQDFPNARQDKHSVRLPLSKQADLSKE